MGQGRGVETEHLLSLGLGSQKAKRIFLRI
jgi:hypothetical protein